MTMREVMARAAWESNQARLPGGAELTPWEAAPDEQREIWFGIVDAVLAAMRKPTENMIRQGIQHGTAENVWKAMLAAAS